MSYTPTEWATGDVITADKLNNMESGIVNAGVMIATITEDSGSYTSDKSSTEIKTALDSGNFAFCKVFNAPGGYSYLPLYSFAMNPDGSLQNVTFLSLDVGTIPGAGPVIVVSRAVIANMGSEDNVTFNSYNQPISST